MACPVLMTSRLCANSPGNIKVYKQQQTAALSKSQPPFYKVRVKGLSWGYLLFIKLVFSLFYNLKKKKMGWEPLMEAEPADL